jgi:hypothetical protein
MPAGILCIDQKVRRAVHNCKCKKKHYVERFPPKLLDFGDKEALKSILNRAFLSRVGFKNPTPGKAL